MTHVVDAFHDPVRGATRGEPTADDYRSGAIIKGGLSNLARMALIVLSTVDWPTIFAST